MKTGILPKGLLLILTGLAGAALYWSGSYVVYILAYSFSFVFLLCYTVFAPSAIGIKIVQGIVYALILAAQVLFAVLVMRPASGGGQLFALCRLLGVLMILVPFLIKRLWEVQR